MANRELFNSNDKILGQYLQQPVMVASINSTQSAPVLSINVTLPASGYYALQGYLCKEGAGAVDSTTSTRIFTPASQGWGELTITPAMIPPFATEPGVPIGLSTTFYAIGGPTTLEIAPGANLNLGASGAIEAQLWFLGSQ